MSAKLHAFPAQNGSSLAVTIIIGNYNYAHYLSAAIDSALGLDWPNVQVIVVDDGSTDQSRAIIAGYGDRILAIFKANGGQPSAFNCGFAAARGDIVFFLDSDDLLDADAARAVAAVWSAGVAKVQFPLRTIDAAGRADGGQFPNFHHRPSPALIRQQVLATGLYPCPPTSGNAFARRMLAQIFPLPERQTGAADGLLNVAAPLFGDVVTLLEPHACYRVHGQNAWAQDRLDPAKFAKFIRDDLQRVKFLAGLVAAQRLTMAAAPLDHLPGHLQYRLASLRLAPAAHPVPQDRIGGLLIAALLALARDRSLGFAQRALLMGWFTGVALLPRALAQALITLRFVPQARPQPIRRLLRLFGAVKPIALMAALMLAVPAHSAPAAEVPPVAGNWQLSFNQDFSDSGLDRRIWRTQYRFGRTLTSNGEEEWYTDDSFDREPGGLAIIARRQHADGKNTVDGAAQGFDYTSGVMTTELSFAQLYGYFEIKARVPAGKGLWSAFWLLPQNQSWPPEIDVMEILGHQPDKIFLTLHYVTPQQTHGAEQRACQRADMSRDFHTYAVDWRPGQLTWYLDGSPCFSTRIGVPTVPMYLLANLAVGGHWPGHPDADTVFPARMAIAWIRVWREKGAL